MNQQTMPDIGLGITVDLPYETAVRRAEEELAKEGFGVLTRIDVRATMKKKLDLDYPPFEILGACNPQLADQALNVEPRVSLMMPCNVVIRQIEDGRTRIELVNPEAMSVPFPQADLSEMVGEARERRDAAIFPVDDYDEFKAKLDDPGGFLLAHWCGDVACEDRVQQETKATIRCLAFDQPEEKGRCFVCGGDSTRRAHFAKAY